MRILIFFIFTLYILGCSSPKPSDIREIVITDVTIIPMTGEEDILENQSVVIQKERIFKIGQHTPSTNATIIDGSGKFIVPGLTEMHAHIPVAKEGNDTLVKETLFLYLSQGITTIRGMLGDPYHLSLRTEIENGTVFGPRIYTSSPSLNGNSIKTIKEAQSKVTQYKVDGYDFLKIHPGIQLEVWNEVEKTANEVGIPYAGHVPVNVGIRRALAAGYGTIDHIDGFVEGLVPASANVAADANGFFGYNFTDLVDVKLIPELVQLAIDNNVGVVPTQTLFTRWFSPTDASIMMSEPEMKYMPASTRFTWRQNKTRLTSDSTYNKGQWRRFIEIRKSLIREMDKQGITILLGSDAPQVMNVPGFSLHHEMNDMSKIGLSNYKILQSGTVNPAKYFNASQDYGTVREGQIADLILLSANPLKDINNMSKIESVIVKGTILSKTEIKDRLETIQKRNL